MANSPPVVMYSSSLCIFCMRARRLLKKKGIFYSEISVDGDPDLRREMIARSGRTSVPQIFVGDHHVGGCDDLFAMERAGELDALLESA